MTAQSSFLSTITRPTWSKLGEPNHNHQVKEILMLTLRSSSRCE